MINSKYLALLAVVEMKTITRAAEYLGYTQSGVSHLITTLEAELGLTLLIRSKSGAVLTEEGKAILPYIRHVLDAEQNLSNIALDLQGVKTGTLRIGTFSSVAIHWLPALLAQFKKRYPAVEVSVYNGDYAQVEERLISNSIDCGFVTLPSRTEFNSTLLTNDRLMAVVPEDSLLSKQREITPSQLQHETFIMPAEGRNYDIGKFFSQAGVTLQDYLNINDDYAAIEMVRLKLGVTILPELMIKNMPMAGLCAIPLSGSARKIGIATHGSRYLSPATKAFLVCVQEFFTQQISNNSDN